MENMMNLSQNQTLDMLNNGTLSYDGGCTTFANIGNADAITTTDFQLGYCDYWPYYQTYHYHYPYPITITPNKTETAFRVVKVLIDKKLTKIQTVKQLVELMDAIVKVV